MTSIDAQWLNIDLLEYPEFINTIVTYPVTNIDDYIICEESNIVNNALESSLKKETEHKHIDQTQHLMASNLIFCDKCFHDLTIMPYHNLDCQYVQKCPECHHRLEIYPYHSYDCKYA